METKPRDAKVVVSVLAVAGLVVFSLMGYAGSLEPTGPPAPTMKTLDEVEPRIPISQSDIPLTITDSGSYYFTGDLTYPSTEAGYAITVEANNVTIDLMGYSLVGPGAGQNYGIWIVGRHNVEIRNGTITNFGGYGIATAGFLDKGDRVINIRVVYNGKAGSYAGMYLFGKHHLIKDCTAIGNTAYGIFAADNSIVAGSTAHSNQSSGIYTEKGCTVTGNAAYDNSNIGIIVGACCTVSSNSAYDNANSGLSAGYGSTVTGNAATDNSFSGIKVGEGVTVTGNTACMNGFHGIETNNGCTVTNNTAYGNQQHGIYVGDDCLLDRNTAILNNQSAGGFSNIYTGASCTTGLNEQ